MEKNVLHTNTHTHTHTQTQQPHDTGQIFYPTNSPTFDMLKNRF